MKRPISRTRSIPLLVFGALLLVAPALGTDLLVVSFLSVRDCGLGVNTFRSEHHGDLFNVSQAHRNLQWQIDGVLGECHNFTWVDPYSYRAIHCESSGFVATTTALRCVHQKDKYCKNEPKMHARTEGFVGHYAEPVRTREHGTLCQSCRSDVVFPEYATGPGDLDPEE